MSSIIDKLLAHYDVNARDLPWRAGPNSPPTALGNRRINPYHVWLSEIMLQQTTVAAVIPYFEKFTSRWPDFHALAAADDADIMAAWAGLGYYARARNLVKCARVVTAEHDGHLPQTEDELRTLPGIGDYTAAAIASIAFGKRALVMDANIERVMARLFEIDTPLPKGKREIKSALDKIIPNQRTGDIAQAMMDLGASICSVKNPKCDICPIVRYCGASKSDNAINYPVKRPKKAKPTRVGAAWWIIHNSYVLLVKRQDSGMLGGMMALPDDGWRAGQDGDEILQIAIPQNLIAKKWQSNDQIEHVFTHFSLKLKLTTIELSKRLDIQHLARDNALWWPIDDIDNAGLPTLFAKAAKIMTKYECI